MEHNKQQHQQKSISPRQVLTEIAAAIPEDCHPHLIVIGSLAVGYHYFGEQAEMVVRTKDADCVLSPLTQAVPRGRKITEQLFASDWTFRPDKLWSEPGTVETPDDKLPAVRLNPPNCDDWFLELLTVPDPAQTEAGQQWTRLETENGHFGVCSFRFLSLANFEPIKTSLGIYIARPEMMALAALLEHPVIRTQLMSGGFSGRDDIKRSNKDLGRVLAIARLAARSDEDVFDTWSTPWQAALQDRFPDSWRDLAARAGNGLRTLLDREEDLEQAHHTVANGLLASDPPTMENLRIVGERLLLDAIEPLNREVAG